MLGTLKVGVLHSPYAQIIVTLCPAGASTAVGQAAAESVGSYPLEDAATCVRGLCDCTAVHSAARTAAAVLHVSACSDITDSWE